ncbi:hypothetical protein [Actinocrispum wychmicini]|uniref:Uncharacterized protein n=1 Tax=Actinocrispum wychmicini TaxID=1213861 RepID=A0A4R2IYJ0_9PSEU|nr:hypothetical protein [Actinocrispum wychmicini]TCO47995.1 hypothetical protein EV192_11648 [Actinocrispum wychmicini]
MTTEPPHEQQQQRTTDLVALLLTQLLGGRWTPSTYAPGAYTRVWADDPDPNTEEDVTVDVLTIHNERSAAGDRSDPHNRTLWWVKGTPDAVLNAFRALPAPEPPPPSTTPQP